ncbi:MAG: hypothetical protein J6104_03720 [Methanomicrobium sp.]|nr:hypothetical protein [Methanomicrobium sp.]
MSGNSFSLPSKVGSFSFPNSTNLSAAMNGRSNSSSAAKSARSFSYVDLSAS